MPAPSPLSADGLNLWFDTYNSEYFSGRLPKVPVVYSPIEALGTCNRRIIRISERLIFSQRLTRETLVHEMVHLGRYKYQWLYKGFRRKQDIHGHLFKQDIKALVMAGAYDDLL